jgi:threonine dehydrogenase-like Zn-dependent dehydrogenase
LTFQNYLAEFVRREIRLVTTFGYTRRDFLVGNRLYGAGRIDLSPLVGPTIGLEEVPETLAYIDEHGTGGKRYVVDIGMPG